MLACTRPATYTTSRLSESTGNESIVLGSTNALLAIYMLREPVLA